MLAHRDREADIHLAAGSDHRVGVEAAVGAHRELTARSGLADPPHRLREGVGRAPSAVRPARAQPCHQHLTGPGCHREQRVIAPRSGVAGAAGPLLGEAVGLAERGIEVDGEG